MTARSSLEGGAGPGDRPRFYIGLATSFHDPAVAIVGPDGGVLFAEATERYLQNKRAINCEPDSVERMADLLSRHLPVDGEVCLATSWGTSFSSYLRRCAGHGLFDIDRIAGLSATVGSTLAAPATERAYTAALHHRQAGAGIGTAIGMVRAFGEPRIAGLRRYRHHETHAAFAAWGSPFDEAACLVVDGVAEKGSVSLFHYRDGRLRPVPAAFGTVSPGLLYALLTDVCGFDSLRGEEWKLMGLAPYGRDDPDLTALIRQLYRVDERGRAVRASAEVVAKTLTDLAARRPGSADETGWADLAHASQVVFADLMDGYLRQARALPVDDLVLTGGCALNSSYNGQVLERHGYARLHVPSAPADDGNAVGAALLAWAQDHPGERPAATTGRPLTAYLGSTVDTAPLTRIARHEPRLIRLGARLIPTVAGLLAGGLLVGWVQGRAEYGPRALGNRSILADPRRPGMRDTINDAVKLREGFRPFAPAILAERAGDWFVGAQPSPYMERTLVWRPGMRDRVPAVVHVDGTGRLQTVTREGNARFWELLVEFERLTGVPVLLNTSLNVMGKPIAHSTEDALTIFHTTGLDALVIDDWLITKREAP